MNELRHRALTYTEAEQQRDAEKRRKASPEFQRKLERNVAGLAATKRRLVAATTPASRERLEQKLEDLNDAMDEFQESQLHRLTWSFESNVDRWRHQVLTRLVTELETLDWLHGRVRQRHEISSTMSETTTRGALADWDVVRRSMISDPRFRGIDLHPQLGLVPLGRDRRSKTLGVLACREWGASGVARQPRIGRSEVARR